MIELNDKTWNDFISKNEKVLVDVYGDSCGPCQRMEPILIEAESLNRDRVAFAKIEGVMNMDSVAQYGISGVPTLMYFKSGKLLKHYLHKLIENNETVNGEYYVTLVYNQMIRDGLSVIHYPTDNYVCLGTPYDLISFKYWESVFKNNMTDEEINSIKNYWKMYHDIN